MVLFKKPNLVKFCPIFDGSASSCLIKYQKIVWEVHWGAKTNWILLASLWNSTTITMLAHIFMLFELFLMNAIAKILARPHYISLMLPFLKISGNHFSSISYGNHKSTFLCCIFNIFCIVLCLNPIWYFLPEKQNSILEYMVKYNKTENSSVQKKCSEHVGNILVTCWQNPGTMLTTH